MKRLSCCSSAAIGPAVPDKRAGPKRPPCCTAPSVVVVVVELHETDNTDTTVVASNPTDVQPSVQFLKTNEKKI